MREPDKHATFFRYEVEMIAFIIKNATKTGGTKGWIVKHPTNDAILAYTDTEGEADEVIRYLAAVADHFDAVGLDLLEKKLRGVEGSRGAMTDR